MKGDTGIMDSVAKNIHIIPMDIVVQVEMIGLQGDLCHLFGMEKNVPARRERKKSVQYAVRKEMKDVNVRLILMCGITEKINVVNEKMKSANASYTSLIGMTN